MAADTLVNIIIPILSSTIGAVIGGFIAYKIAQIRFSSDNMKEGLAGMFAMQVAAKEIVKSGESVRKVLSIMPTNEKEASVFWDQVKGVNGAGDRLFTSIDSFKANWVQYQDRILRCALPPITSNEKQRAKYLNVYDDINKLMMLMDEFRRSSSNLLSQIKNNDANELGYEQDSIKLVLSAPEFGRKIDNARNSLESIEKLCKGISESVDAVGHKKHTYS